MARRETVVLTDDLDGSPATQTVRFGLSGTEYEIDLNDENAKELTSWLENYISHARRVGGRPRRGGSRIASDTDAKAVRAWAHAQGIRVNPRGRIPAHLVERYNTTHSQ